MLKSPLASGNESIEMIAPDAMPGVTGMAVCSICGMPVATAAAVGRTTGVPSEFVAVPLGWMVTFGIGAPGVVPAMGLVLVVGGAVGSTIGVPCAFVAVPSACTVTFGIGVAGVAGEVFPAAADLAVPGVLPVAGVAVFDPLPPPHAASSTRPNAANAVRDARRRAGP